MALLHISDNRLLAALPRTDRRRIVNGGETVQLALSELLHSPWKPPKFIYFPISSFVSLNMPSADSAGLEVGLVGNEGMLGISLALNIDMSGEQATVRGGGAALRMDATALQRELKRSGVLRGEIDRYVHVRMGQLAQASICARFHMLEARVACRLLMTQDCAQTNALHMTHENLASKLGCDALASPRRPAH